MNRYHNKDSHGEVHIIDADALDIQTGTLSFAKKGSPGYIAQFRDWHSYTTAPIAEPVATDAPRPILSVEALSDPIERVKRQYNRKS